MSIVNEISTDMVEAILLRSKDESPNSREHLIRLAQDCRAALESLRKASRAHRLAGLPPVINQPYSSTVSR